jgi:hypothetical protein
MSMAFLRLFKSRSATCRLVFGSFASFSLVFGQTSGDALYLLSGYPLPDNIEYGLPANLYAVMVPSMKPAFVRTVLQKNDGTAAVHYNAEHRLITLISATQQPFISVLSMTDPGKQVRIPFDPEYRSLISSNLLDIPGRGLIQSIYLVGTKAKSLKPRVLGDGNPIEGEWIAFDLAENSTALGSPVTLAADDIKYVTADGNAGVLINGKDTFEVILSDDGYLAIPQIGRATRLPLQSAVPGEFKEKGFWGRGLATKEVIAVISSTGTISGQGKLGSANILFYRRANGQWSTFRVAGNQTWLRAFGPWIGIAVSENTHQPGRPMRPPRRTAAEKLALAGSRSTQLTFEDSPGINRPSRIYRDGTMSVFERFESFETYAPGQLILYNVETKKSYAINTKDGDSEILLVVPGFVYYRVNASIFRSAIEESSLSSPTLVAQDPTIVDVHWAFFGPAGPATQP